MTARGHHSQGITSSSETVRYPARYQYLQNRGLCSAAVRRAFPRYIFSPRSLRAFPMTDTELKLMAAAAKIGLSKIPRNG